MAQKPAPKISERRTKVNGKVYHSRMTSGDFYRRM